MSSVVVFFSMRAVLLNTAVLVVVGCTRETSEQKTAFQNADEIPDTVNQCKRPSDAERTFPKALLEGERKAFSMSDEANNKRIERERQLPCMIASVSLLESVVI